METLLEIRTIPAEYEMHIRHARFEISVPRPTHEIHRQRGGLQVSSTPPKVRMSTYETRASMGQKTVARLTEESWDKNLEAALSATAQIVEMGNRLADPLSGAAVPTLLRERYFAEVRAKTDFTVGAIPKVPVQIDVRPGEFEMSYTPDKLIFDWHTSAKARLRFVPAEIEFRLKQLPRLEITYLGKPIYVPPSASPDYEPTFDVRV